MVPFQISAFILAGGRSSRMGQDKALLEIGGRTLAERMMDIASSVAAKVYLVGPPTLGSRFASAKVVEDAFPAHGPLSGIHAALAHTSTDCNLILAVDLPFIPSEFLTLLVNTAVSTDAVVTVPRSVDGYQPLCAVYRRAFLANATKALAVGRNRIDALYSEVQTKIIDLDLTGENAFSAALFRNLNTPADVEDAERELRRVENVGLAD